ncbi:hypothetical protein [Roseovarius sp. M141]|uniref:hypothetical protein n=1 Tax=Roseovarius sp. M141 TaxID=2583806 RepID=UPI0020CD27E3|nr:hypothetical protein [Roseovarius sp. M141]
MFHNTATPDPAVARLRTDQMLRALRVAAKLGGSPAPRVVGLSGQVLEAGDIGGDDARVIEGDADDQHGG